MSSAYRYVTMQLFAKAAGALTLVVLARWTLPSTLGEYAIGLLVASGLSILFDAGSSKSSLRLRASGHARSEIWRVIRSRILVMRSASFGGLAIAATAPASWRLAGIAISLGGVLALNAAAEAALLGEKRGGVAGAGNLTFNLAALIATLAVVRVYGRTSPATLLLLANLLGAVTAQCCYIIARSMTANHPTPHISTPTRTDRVTASRCDALEVRFSLMSTALMSIAFLYFRSDMVILGALGGANILAQYAVAYRVIESALAIPQLMGYSRQAEVTRAWDTSDRHEVQRSTVVGLLWVGYMLAALLLLMGPWLTTAVFGDTYRLAANLLSLLAIGMVGQSLSQATNCYLYGSVVPAGRSLTVISMNLLCVVILWLTLVVGYIVGHAKGLAVGQSAGELAIAYLWMRQVFTSAEVAQPTRVLPGLLCSAVVLLLVAVLPPGAAGTAAGGTLALIVLALTLYKRREVLRTLRDW